MFYFVFTDYLYFPALSIFRFSRAVIIFFTSEYQLPPHIIPPPKPCLPKDDLWKLCVEQIMVQTSGAKKFLVDSEGDDLDKDFISKASPEQIHAHTMKLDKALRRASNLLSDVAIVLADTQEGRSAKTVIDKGMIQVNRYAFLSIIDRSSILVPGQCMDLRKELRDIKAECVNYGIYEMFHETLQDRVNEVCDVQEETSSQAEGENLQRRTPKGKRAN